MHILAISPGEGFDETRWRRILTSGVDALMVREKQLEADHLLTLTRWVREYAPGLSVWVNGRLDVALAAGCGLHAPEAYPEVPKGLVSISRPLHDPADFSDRAEAQQLLLSPVFSTPGKGACLGIEGLHGWLASLPQFDGRLLALGGITPENAKGLQHSRLAGVALVRSLWHSPDPCATVHKLREAWSD